MSSQNSTFEAQRQRGEEVIEQQPASTREHSAFRKRGRRFALTVNRDLDAFELFLKRMWNDEGWRKDVRYICGQRELGEETNHPHIQCYIETHVPLTMTALKSRIFKGQFDHIHVAGSGPARGNQAQNMAYCTKPETRCPGCSPWSYGTPAKEKDGDDPKESLSATIASKLARGVPLTTIAREHPSYVLQHVRSLERFKEIMDGDRFRDLYMPKTCYALIGPTGTGKSHWIWEHFHFDEVCNITPANVQMGGSKNPWFDTYTGQRVIAFQEMPYCLSVGMFLTITDPYPMTVQAKGRSVWINASILIFTSNIPVEDWYPEATMETRRAVLDRFPPGNIKTFEPRPGGVSLRRLHCNPGIPIDEIPPVQRSSTTRADAPINFTETMRAVEAAKDPVALPQLTSAVPPPSEHASFFPSVDDDASTYATSTSPFPQPREDSPTVDLSTRRRPRSWHLSTSLFRDDDEDA